MGLDISVILFCLCVSASNFVSCVSLCDDTAFCPSHKPYCTEAGCVFRCPEDSYVNGSHCVLDCGAMFVAQSGKCIDQCEGGYFRESVRVRGNDIIKDKTCITKCTTPEYVFKNECVQACPVDQPYIDTVNENDHLSTTSYCAESCPPNKQYKTNFTINGLSYIKCTNVCGVLVQNEYCTTKCENGYVKLSKTCLKTCPETHPVLYSSTMTCYKECTNDTFNVECACPTSRPFVENQTCVFKCSEASPYKEQTKAITMCVSTCKPKQYVHSSNCVDTCPLNTFVNDKTCKEQCPKGTLSFNKTSIWLSSNGMCIPSITKLCVHECPGGTYQMENKCVYGCDKGLFLKNNTCVDSCFPEDFRQTRVVSFKTASKLLCKYPDTFNTEYVECVDECDKDNFALNGTCVSSCPADYVVEHNSCVETCSDNNVQVNVSLTLNGCKSRCPINVYRQYVQCQEKCPSGQFAINNTCAFVCPSNLLAFQGSCVEYCPPTSAYKQTLSVEYKIWQRTFYGFTSYTKHADIIACVTNCTEQPYTFYNNASQRCVQQCPAEYVVDHDSCVETCSNNGVLVNISLTVNGCKSRCPVNVYRQYFQCQEKCPSGQFAINNTCAFVCPSNLLAFQGSCVEYCPPTSAYKQTLSVEYKIWQRTFYGFTSYTKHADIIACVTNCTEQPYTFYNNASQRCVQQCPAEYVVDHDSCVETCSNNGVLVNISLTVNGCKSRCPVNVYRQYFQCQEKCPSGQFAINNTCAFVCPSNLLAFQGSCVEYCPPTSAYKQTLSVEYKIWQRTFYGFTSYTKHADIIACVTNCTEQPYTFYNNASQRCVQECPADYVVDHDSCVETCSNNGVLVNISLTVNGCKSWCPINVYRQYVQCQENCPLGQFRMNNTCVFVCPSKFVVLEGKCVQSCPPTSPYKQTFSFKDEKWHQHPAYLARGSSYKEQITAIRCATNCSEPYVYDNITDICMLKCPAERPYASRVHSVEGMRTCVSNCTGQYIYKSEYCVDLCPKDMPFVQSGYCVSSCPAFVNAGTCVDKCPQTVPNIYNDFTHNYCVNECPSGRVLDRDNNKCINTFECSVFLYNRTCVNECPSDQPFDLGDYQRTCVKDCAANNKIQNGTLNICIRYRECEGGSDGVIFDEKCISECSDGYLCYYSITEGHFSCMKRHIPIVVCTVFVLIWTFVVVYGAGSMWAYIFVIRLSLSKDQREKLFAEKRAPRNIEVMENDYSFECTDEDALL
ncbi:proprotein convertase subtilisin/kexin type 5-like [Mya arenaria]|uniref:proprotein convertase subtilisin/kexin type 5-like n=1 Tax=Mya arenaria TaxID=6604 RepID=UPI0022E7F0BD|nr:proprotein convertase subtilisin/kexin type 5-like [Mya arenaria]